jgi:hypothetical protein
MRAHGNSIAAICNYQSVSDEEGDGKMEGAVVALVDAPMEEVKVEVVDVSDVVHEWMKNKLPNVEIERAEMRMPSDISAARFFVKWSQAYPSVWESLSDATHDALYAVVKNHLGRGAEGSDRIRTSHGQGAGRIGARLHGSVRWGRPCSALPVH